MTVIFQLRLVGRGFFGKQCVFGVCLYLGTGGVVIVVSLPRLGLHGDVEVLRLSIAGQQADNAEQTCVSRILVIFTGAQQVSASHCVQRQDKTALIVAQRIRKIRFLCYCFIFTVNFGM